MNRVRFFYLYIQSCIGQDKKVLSGDPGSGPTVFFFYTVVVDFLFLIIKVDHFASSTPDES